MDEKEWNEETMDEEEWNEEAKWNEEEEWNEDEAMQITSIPRVKKEPGRGAFEGLTGREKFLHDQRGSLSRWIHVRTDRYVALIGLAPAMVWMANRTPAEVDALRVQVATLEAELQQQRCTVGRLRRCQSSNGKEFVNKLVRDGIVDDSHRQYVQEKLVEDELEGEWRVKAALLVKIQASKEDLSMVREFAVKKGLFLLLHCPDWLDEHPTLQSCEEHVNRQLGQLA